MQEFLPHLEVLPAAQRKLWTELSAVPGEFMLYGGTALALHFGHRHSIDFDFFANRALDLSALEARIPFLFGARIVQREKNTLSAIVDRGGRVRVSFSGVPNLPRLGPPHVAKDNGLRVASLIDLAGTKASVLQMRAESKDYVDIDALLRLGNIGLSTSLAAAQKLYGSSFNPEITLKALSYFGDGDLGAVPEEVKERWLWQRAKLIWSIFQISATPSLRELEIMDMSHETHFHYISDLAYRAQHHLV